MFLIPRLHLSCCLYRGLHSQVFKDKIRRISPLIKVVFTTVKSRNCFHLPKLSFNILNASNFIYEFVCGLCSSNYIGRTKRIFFHRITEHYKADLGSHFRKCNPNISFDNFTSMFKILNTAHWYTDLCILESLYINCRKPNINMQLRISSEYRLSLNFI